MIGLWKKLCGTGAQSDPEDQVLRATRAHARMRTIVGAIAFMLPISLVLIGLARGVPVQRSISAYYHTEVRDLLVGPLFAIAFFLFGYGAYSRVDDVAASIAGFGALGVALFPANTMATAHGVSTAVLLLTLAFFCLCLFTRGPVEGQPAKQARNHLYRACGKAILLAISLMGLRGLLNALAGRDLFEGKHVVLILEWLALSAFGIAWSVKGNVRPGKLHDPLATSAAP